MIKIEVYRGDISQFEFDVLVNAANNHLWMGSGVAGALKKSPAGQEIEKEAVSKGPITVGDAVATGAGKLKARYVIHAAVMGQDLSTDETKIRQATGNSLRLAEELGLKSLAFPALGTGVGGFPLEDCARVMMEEVRRYASGKTGIETVAFILYDRAAFEIFQRELDRTKQ